MGSTDPTNVVVPTGGTATDDTGYVQPPATGVVGGVIYIDVNGDGLYTPGTDIPLGGVDVLITDVNGNTQLVTTLPDGTYTAVVPAGNTVVDVVDATLPAGVTLTTNVNGQGSDPTIVFVPAGGSANDSTGYVYPLTSGTVNGTVYIDVDGDGIYTPGTDTPLPNVVVVVTDAFGGVYILITNASGQFSQTVPAGNTVVDVIEASLPPGVSILTVGSTDPTLVVVPVGGTGTDNTGYQAAPTPTATLTPTATPTGGGGGGNSPDLRMVKSRSGSFTIGQLGTFLLTVSNIGGPTTGAITVTDPLPPGLTFVSGTGVSWTCGAVGQLVTCTHPGPLAPGASTTITLVVYVGAAAYPTITNSATVSTPGDSNPVNDTDYAPTTIRPGSEGTPLPTAGVPTATPIPQPPDLRLTKSGSGLFRVGELGTYLLTVSNIGGPTTGAITVTDPLPAGLTFVSGTGTSWTCGAAGQLVTCTHPGPLAPGASTVITLVVYVGGAAYPTVTNSATVNTAGDSNAGNNTAFAPTTIRSGTEGTAPPTATGVAMPTPTATATRTPVVVAPDLRLTKSHSGSFKVGQTASYVLTVANIGGPTTGAITVTDPLPAGLAFVTAGGTSWTCSAAGQLITCTHPGPLAPGASTSITLVVYVGSAAYPTVTNSATVITAGDSNAGNNTAYDPTTIRSGTEITPPPTVSPVATPTPGGPLPTPTATGTTGPTLPPDCELNLVKTHSGAPKPGRVVPFKILWGGRCASAGAVTIVDALPDGLTLVSASASSGATVSTSGNTVTINVPSISSPGSAIIRALVSPLLPIDTQVCNTAVLTDSHGRQVASRDCFRVVMRVTQQRLLLHGHNYSRPGRQLTYTARYFRVNTPNELTLVIPPRVTVVRIHDPQPASVNGRVYTWRNVPPVSGKVRMTVILDPTLDYWTVLPAEAVLVDSAGTDTANHGTIVAVPASAGQGSTENP